VGLDRVASERVRAWDDTRLRSSQFMDKALLEMMFPVKPFIYMTEMGVGWAI
jgi:hypothetical protein